MIRRLAALPADEVSDDDDEDDARQAARDDDGDNIVSRGATNISQAFHLWKGKTCMLFVYDDGNNDDDEALLS